MSATLPWLLRAAHVLSASIWLAGYAAVLAVLIPLLKHHTSAALERTAITVERASTYAGTATLFFGLMLIGQTRGYGALGAGEWGLLVISCIGIAVATLGIGSAGLLPALRHLAATGDARRARRWASVGMGLLALAYVLMTRTLYAA